jgi:hypothetical protein
MKNITKMMVVTAALALSVLPANAAKQFNQTDEINLSVFVPCADGGAGEVVDLSGPLHTLITYTITGRNVSGTTHSQPQGITGVGESTGDKYQATGVTSNSFKMSFQNGRATQTYINRFDIIGQGPGNNFRIQETIHYTFNANGTVTVFFDNVIVECN